MYFSNQKHHWVYIINCIYLTMIIAYRTERGKEQLPNKWWPVGLTPFLRIPCSVVSIRSWKVGPIAWGCWYTVLVLLRSKVHFGQRFIFVLVQFGHHSARHWKSIFPVKFICLLFCFFPFLFVHPRSRLTFSSISGVDFEDWKRREVEEVISIETGDKTRLYQSEMMELTVGSIRQ